MPEKKENEISQELVDRVSFYFLNDIDLLPTLDLYARNLMSIEKLTNRLFMLKRISELRAEVEKVCGKVVEKFCPKNMEHAEDV